MAFVDMHIFSRDFLHFDMSLLLLTFTLRGVSNKHCLLSLFSFVYAKIEGIDQLSCEANYMSRIRRKLVV